MYTDGLTEAANQDGEEMGVERLIDYFNNSSPHSTKDFVHQALTCVAKFTGCTNQADDICMLGISYSEHEAKRTVNSRFLTFLQPASSSLIRPHSGISTGKASHALPFRRMRTGVFHLP